MSGSADGKGTSYLKVREAAEQLGVSQGTVRNAIERGRLAAYRFEGAVRIRPVDLAEYIERSGPPAPTPKAPAPKVTALKHLDGARSRAAWEKQGVRILPDGKH